MTESTPLPPLPPPRLEEVRRPGPSRVPLAVAAAALLVAGVMALLWLTARSNERDTLVERDALIAERDTAIDASIEAEAELQTVRDELQVARTERADGADDTTDSASPDPDEIETLNDRIADLEAEVERLEDANSALATELEAAESPDDESLPTTTASTEPATSVPDETESEATAPDEQEAEVPSDVSAEDVGDQISGLFRGSVLGSLQKLCLGQAVLDDLGVERTLTAIDAESPEDDEDFVRAVSDAAESCNIDPSAVFG